MKYHDINTLLDNEGINECFEIGCIYAVEDMQVNYRSCDCPSHDEKTALDYRLSCRITNIFLNPSNKKSKTH
jgi:hypothetical protein